MIPQIIHYCWFGHGEKPVLMIRCIESWRRMLPEYIIKEWNEENFNVFQNQYVREAYENKKYAFVTDYVRLYAIYTEGGIYMDTDVEVIGSYNQFLHHHAFSGFETDGYVPTGMMAAEKGSLWAKDLLNQYECRTFILPNGKFDMTTNTTVITNYMLSKGLIQNNKYQDFPGLCTMYPSDYFCPKDHRTGIIKCTPNTVCIHHFSGSWLEHSLWKDFRHNLKLFIAKILGDKVAIYLSDVLTMRIFSK